MPRWAVYLLGIIPALWLFYQALTGQLGADPVKGLEHGLGLWALRYLVVGLAITPLRRFTGINLTRYRRAIGLLAFFYATLHLLVYVALDQALDWSGIIADLTKRPYIIIGMIGFLLLVPLAVTSNNASIRRWGGKAWQRLHRLVYPAVFLGALHFLILVKSWPLEPIIYMGLVIVLLALRPLATAWENMRRGLPPPPR